MPSKTVDDLLAQLLFPRLGYVCASWPRRLYDRIGRRAASSGCTPAQWLGRLVHGADGEIDALIDVATIGHTAFFRHPEQFAEFRNLLRSLASAGCAPIRIWCAGCSSGEEAYSIALTAEEEKTSVAVLGTDVNPFAIQTARAGRYSATCSSRVPGDAPEWAAPAALRRIVQFEVSSLVGPNPALGKGPFDVIFCRNVLIYFRREDVADVLASLAEELRPEGVLIVSPADTVLPMPPCLTRHAQPGRLHLTQIPPASLRQLGLVTESRSAASIHAGVRSTAGLVAESALDRAARHLGSGQPAEAETVLAEWLNTNPDDIGGWFLLGEALLQRGEKAQARTAFIKASQCTPRHIDQIDGNAMRGAARRRAEELLD
jgi:chemotaxis protein methyltransferase CheR